MKIIICGDTLPRPSNQDCFINGSIDELLDKELKILFDSADFMIGNLEGPLTDTRDVIEKSGVCLYAPIKTISGLKRIGFSCFSLANNHIMDYGVEGINNTLETLNKNSIIYLGGGKNNVDARKSYIYVKDNVSVGFYACAEREFTISGEDTPGANGFDDLYTLDDIQELKRKCDFVVVLYHGMKEYYQYPIPYVQERCRRMIAKGANLVLCQHSHCIGCMEKWSNGEIVYGQGDFLFHFGDNSIQKTGLIICLENKNGEWKIEYIPVTRSKYGTKRLDQNKSEKVLCDFYERSKISKSTKFVEENYTRFAQAHIREYYNQMFGKLSVIPRILYKLGIKDIYEKLYSRQGLLNLQNCLQCEAHRDLFLTGLKSTFDINNPKKRKGG